MLKQDQPPKCILKEMRKTKKFINQIDCPIFFEYEEDIKKLSDSINGHRVVSKKVGKAHELLKIIEILSDCSKYDNENVDCENCHLTLRIKREVARIVIEASEIHLEN